VRVRLLLDARMYETYPRTADSLDKVPGIAVRRIDLGRIAGGVQHAKFFIVDDEVIYLGSQNFDWRALKHVHELGVRIRDRRVVRAFRPVFEMDWAAADSVGGAARRDSAATAARGQGASTAGRAASAVGRDSGAAVRSVALQRPDGSTATMTVRLGNPRPSGEDSARAPRRVAILPPAPDPIRPLVREGPARSGSDENGAPAKTPTGVSGLSQTANLPYAIVQAPGDTVELWPSYSPRSFIPDSTLWDRDAIVRMLGSARREVVVQLLTYSPEDRGRRDDAIDAALRRAARRGAKVRLLVSDWEADRPAMRNLESLTTEPNFEVRLSSVPEWSGGYIPFARVEHCKYAVVDSAWTWLGTSNWEPSYFHGSRNIAVTMRNRPLALEARRVFEASWIAPSAIGVRPGARYAPRVHGTAPPPGKRKYGE
jgi:phosphatidylserine/phosphatidylglycerophosphate/cardiolipin synthase-like enzyme